MADDIEARLWDWADWAKRRADGVGWPPRNVLARFVDDGGILSHATGGGLRRLLEADPDIARTEAAVLAVRRVSERLYRALLLRLLTGGTDAQRAARAGISEAAFESRWRRAKEVCAYLLGEGPQVRLRARPRFQRRAQARADATVSAAPATADPGSARG